MYQQEDSEQYERQSSSDFEHSFLSSSFICPCGFYAADYQQHFLHTENHHPQDSGQDYWRNRLSIRSQSDPSAITASASSSYKYMTSSVSPPTQNTLYVGRDTEPLIYANGPSPGMEDSDCFGYRPAEGSSSGMQSPAKRITRVATSDSFMPRLLVFQPTTTPAGTSTSTSASICAPSPMVPLRAPTRRENNRIASSSILPGPIPRSTINSRRKREAAAENAAKKIRPAESLETFKCKKPGCAKSYKQEKGRKYHYTHGKCIGSGTPLVASASMPAPAPARLSTPAPTASSSTLPSGSMQHLAGAFPADCTPDYWAQSRDISPPIATTASSFALTMLPYTFSVAAGHPLATVATVSALSPSSASLQLSATVALQSPSSPSSSSSFSSSSSPSAAAGFGTHHSAYTSQDTGALHSVQAMLSSSSVSLSPQPMTLQQQQGQLYTLTYPRRGHPRIFDVPAPVAAQSATHPNTLLGRYRHQRQLPPLSREECQHQLQEMSKMLRHRDLM